MQHTYKDIRAEKVMRREEKNLICIRFDDDRRHFNGIAVPYVHH